MKSGKGKNLLNYTEQEESFIKRMQAREAELQQQNFAVPEGYRVNMANLLNPTQLKDLSFRLYLRSRTRICRYRGG